MTKFIAIASGKGGVGRTTITINLAHALTKFGKDSLIVDANINSAHAALYLGSPFLKPTLNNVLKGTKDIKETAFMHPSGIKLIPSETSIYNASKTSLQNLGDSLIGLMGTTEIVLVDVASGFNDDIINSFKSVDEIILVATPDMASVSECLKTMNIAEEYGVDVIGVIVNKISSDNELTESNVSVLLEKPVLGVIPEDRHIKKSLLLKHPVGHHFPDSPSAVAFKQTAAKLIGQEYNAFTSHKKGAIEKFKSSIKDTLRI